MTGCLDAVMLTWECEVYSPDPDSVDCLGHHGGGRGLRKGRENAMNEIRCVQFIFRFISFMYLFSLDTVLNKYWADCLQPNFK